MGPTYKREVVPRVGLRMSVRLSPEWVYARARGYPQSGSTYKRKVVPRVGLRTSARLSQSGPHIKALTTFVAPVFFTAFITRCFSLYSNFFLYIPKLTLIPQ